MSSLSRDFLTTIAREYQLSQEQEEAFVELYSGDGNEVKVADITSCVIWMRFALA